MQPIDLILGKLNGVRGAGEQQWIACCPAHDDKRQSLTISVGEDDRVLLKCFAGCETEDVVSALGLAMKDLYVTEKDDLPVPTPDFWVDGDKHQRHKVVERYNYVDAHGKTLYVVCRTEDKYFPVWNPEIEKFSMGKAERVLYRLNKVLPAAKSGGLIFLVEGEKDVHSLEGIGLLATSSPGGAAAKWLPQYTEALQGAAVICIPDNDLAGRRHMEKAQEALRTAGIKCYIFEVRGLPEKGDISDVVARKDFTPEAMRRWLLDEAQALRDADKPKPHSLSSAELTERCLVDIERRRRGEIKGLPWPLEWAQLGRDLGPIEQGSFTIIAARPSVGKTMFAQQLQAFLGDKGYRVLFVTRELTAERLGRRHIAREGANILHLRRGDIDVDDEQAIEAYVEKQKKWDVWYDFESRTVEDISREVEIVEPDCVIIDYLQRLAYNTENEYAAITRIVNEVQDLVIDLNVPLVLVSQLRRPISGKEHVVPVASDTRGSGAVEERATNLVLMHRNWETQRDEMGRSVASTPTKTGLFIVAKNADGVSGNHIPVLFQGERMRVTELIDRG